MIEQLMEAFDEYYNAKKEYDEAAKTCEYDRSYFLYSEMKRVKSAKKSIEENLISIIREEIAKVKGEIESD